MPPKEVAGMEHYNESCDTYSFGLVLWQMITLDVPYRGYAMEDFYKKVWQSPNDRPPIEEGNGNSDDCEGVEVFGGSIRTLLGGCWTPNPRERPCMSTVEKTLKDRVLEVNEGKHNDDDVESALHLDHSRRRSTHVFKPIEELNNASWRSSNFGNGSLSSLGAAFNLSFRRK